MGKKKREYVVFDQILKRKKSIPFSKVNKEVAKKNEKKIGKMLGKLMGNVDGFEIVCYMKS